MVFPGVSFKVPKPMIDLLNLLVFVRFMLRQAFFHLGLSHPADQLQLPELYTADDYVPSPLLVPVPVTDLSPTLLDSIKKKLPLMEFQEHLEKSGETEKEQEGEDDWICPICLSSLEMEQEIRELCNCCHVFHRECLDKWIDHGQITCPVCRSKLISIPGGREEDPWMLERIAYLFGDNFLLESI